MNRFNSFLGIGLMGLMIGLGSVSMAACGDDDDDDNVQGSAGKAGTAGSAGKAGSSGGGGQSGTAGQSGTGGQGGGGQGGGGGKGGQGGGGGLSLYDRLGGKQGVRDFVSGEVVKVLAVTEYASYFGAQVANPIPAGHPSGAQIIECFSRLVGSAVGETSEKYPGDPVNDAKNTNTPNFTCRSMEASHVGLRINGDTFDTFVTVLATDLQAGVTIKESPAAVGEISQAELGAIGKALTDTKADIVDETIANDGQGPDPQPAP